MASPQRQRAGRARWHSAAQVLADLRRHPGTTRAAMAQRLELASGLATEITARLRELRLIAESPAPVQGRGRPTTILLPHPDGPVVLALQLRVADWRLGIATLDGRLHELEVHPHGDRDPATVLAALRSGIDRIADRYGPRLRAVSLAAPGTVRDHHLVQAATSGWGRVALTGLAPGVPLLLGNDATLAGVAEARSGAAVGASTALHLIVEVGIGGALTVDGQPLTGAHGGAGEYGHMPFGDPALRCPCGARGCWDLAVDGRALARLLGESTATATAPADPRDYAWRVLERGDEPARRAVATVAGNLGAGVGALVNAHDPDLVTLGGLAAPIRRAAPEAFAEGYTEGLMTFHRSDPPAVVDAAHGDDGPLHGAAIVALDAVTSEAALAEWQLTT
jgi:predicted NBD/HSP70 family sugar kinase